MKNTKQQPTNPQQQKLKKLPQLQLLKLEQLDGVAGGPIVTTGNGADTEFP